MIDFTQPLFSLADVPTELTTARMGSVLTDSAADGEHGVWLFESKAAAAEWIAHNKRARRYCPARVDVSIPSLVRWITAGATHIYFYESSHSFHALRLDRVVQHLSQGSTKLLPKVDDTDRVKWLLAEGQHRTNKRM